MTEPFDVDLALTLVGEAIRPFPKAAMFELRERGVTEVWRQLAACVLSIRTRDETSGPLALVLFDRYPTPQSLADADPGELLALISPSTFPGPKVGTLREIGRAAAENGGDLPLSPEALTALPGVGPKCAHLALGVADGLPLIAVDVHVHRVTNRWGYVATRTPEETLAALEARLPDRWRVEINARLVPFGKHVCSARPKCPMCPLRGMCPKRGV